MSKGPTPWNRTGYFSAREVVTVLNYLQICDNPMQEIPFTAVLRSPIVGCSAKELADLKCMGKDDRIYEVCAAYAENGKDETFHCLNRALSEPVPCEIIDDNAVSPAYRYDLIGE